MLIFFIGVVITPLVIRSPHPDAQCRHSFSVTPQSSHVSHRPASEPRLSIDSMDGGRMGSPSMVMARLGIDSTDANTGRSSSPVVLHHCHGLADNGRSSRTIVIRPAYESSSLINKHSRSAQPPALPSKRQSSLATPIDTPIEPLPLPPPLIPVPIGGSLTKDPSARSKPVISRRSHPLVSPQHLPSENQQPAVPLPTPPPVPSRRSLGAVKDKVVSLVPASSDVTVEAAESKNGDQAADTLPSECAVCLERAPDCVLYTCGHMCMCYQCAINVVQNRGALCPICRQPIRDVIKIYRS